MCVEIFGQHIKVCACETGCAYVTWVCMHVCGMGNKDFYSEAKFFNTFGTEGVSFFADNNNFAHSNTNCPLF